LGRQGTGSLRMAAYKKLTFIRATHIAGSGPKLPFIGILVNDLFASMPVIEASSDARQNQTSIHCLGSKRAFIYFQTHAL